MAESELQSHSRAYRGVSAEERAIARKRQFVSAGKIVFGKLGFQGANVKEICAAAGLTERYYYEAFGSVQKLFEAVYLQALDRLRQVLDEAATRSPPDIPAQLRAMITSYFELLKKDRYLARILIIEIYGAAPAIRNLYEVGVRQFTSRIETFVAVPEATTSAQLDRNLVAVALVGAASSLSMHWYLGNYKEPMAVMAENCFAIFNAILGRSSSSFLASEPQFARKRADSPHGE
jgi:AcrR family transcriptional regulator